MIPLQDAFSFVFKNMFEKKKRVFLTISGIIIGIFTITFFIFASQGLSNAITGQFAAFGLNVLAVESVSGNNQNGPPGGGDLTETDLVRVKQVVRDTRYVAPGIFFSPVYEFARERALITSLSYPDENWEEIGEDLGLEIESGRMLRSGDRGVAVIGAKTARDAFQDETLRVGYSLDAGNRSLRIIGIIKERGDLFVDSSLLMPFDDMKEISGQDTFTVIRISFLEGADLEANAQAIERKLNPNQNEKRVEVSSPQEIIDQANQIIGALSLIIYLISLISLLVGGINVMNTMYSNVLERINEISVMKALGGTNGDIRLIFLIESGILGLLGSLLGFIMAYTFAELLSYIITNNLGFNVPVEFSFPVLFGVICITTLLAMLFGTYPAIRAAQVNPSDNLKDE